MKKKIWFDNTVLKCPGCGHTWILRSDKRISSSQYVMWAEELLKEHLKFSKRELNDKQSDFMV